MYILSIKSKKYHDIFAKKASAKKIAVDMENFYTPENHMEIEKKNLFTRKNLDRNDLQEIRQALHFGKSNLLQVH